MIHVDVRNEYHGRPKPSIPASIVVETSVDGSEWKRQYILEVAAFNNYDHAKDEAMHLARVFVAGCRFAGAEVRSTAYGYNN